MKIALRRSCFSWPQAHLNCETTDKKKTDAYLLCRLVAAFRKWLDERGGGGPPTRLSGQLPPLDDRQEMFLDRFNQHTRHCPSCMGVRSIISFLSFHSNTSLCGLQTSVWGVAWSSVLVAARSCQKACVYCTRGPFHQLPVCLLQNS